MNYLLFYKLTRLPEMRVSIEGGFWEAAPITWSTKICFLLQEKFHKTASYIWPASNPDERSTRDGWMDALVDAGLLTRARALLRSLWWAESTLRWEKRKKDTRAIDAPLPSVRTFERSSVRALESVREDFRVGKQAAGPGVALSAFALRYSVSLARFS